jgi:hypothetical protein
MSDDRGQIQTIEGIVAAFIMVFALVVIVQTTSVTPLSSSFTNQHIKLELQNVGNDILSTLDQTPWDINDSMSASELKLGVTTWALLDNYAMFTWNRTAFVSTIDPNVSMTDTYLTNVLKFALIENGTAFNLELRYPDKNGFLYTTKMIWNGDPSENSVTVSRYIVLRDSDVGGVDSVIPKMSTESNSNFHSTVEVRLTLWVM